MILWNAFRNGVISASEEVGSEAIDINGTINFYSYSGFMQPCNSYHTMGSRYLGRTGTADDYYSVTMFVS